MDGLSSVIALCAVNTFTNIVVKFNSPSSERLVSQYLDTLLPYSHTCTLLLEHFKSDWFFIFCNVCNECALAYCGKSSQEISQSQRDCIVLITLLVIINYSLKNNLQGFPFQPRCSNRELCS